MLARSSPRSSCSGRIILQDVLDRGWPKPRTRRIRVATRIAPDDLRRLPERSEERATHPVAVCEAGLVGDGVNRMPAAFHQNPRSLDPEIFDCLGRRLAGLGMEDAAELARAEVRGFRACTVEGSFWIVPGSTMIPVLQNGPT